MRRDAVGHHPAHFRHPRDGEGAWSVRHPSFGAEPPLPKKGARLHSAAVVNPIPYLNGNTHHRAASVGARHHAPSHAVDAVCEGGARFLRRSGGDDRSAPTSRSHSRSPSPRPLASRMASRPVHDGNQVYGHHSRHGREGNPTKNPHHQRGPVHSDDDDAPDEETALADDSSLVSSQFTAAVIDRLEEERANLRRESEHLKDNLTAMRPRLDGLRSANSQLEKLLSRSEAQSDRLRAALEGERSTASLLQSRTTQKEMFEKRFLADGMERVGREKERLEEEVQKMGYRLDKEKVKLEAERKTVKEQRQDIADLKEELVQAGNRLMDEEEEFRQAQKQCMELKANVEAGEAEKRELQADLRQVKKEKADVIKFLQWYQDKCDQDILDLKHFFVLPLGFENAIKRELKSRNPASFGYDGEGKMSIKGFQELCAGVLKLAAFRAEINTKYAVDVELDVEGLHFQYSSRRDALKRVHLLVTFCEKRTGDCVGRTAIELAVISAGAWYEKYYTPSSPHNKHPFKMPPKLIQEPASYLESLRSTQTQAYRDMFSDQSHTVHLVTGKGKKRYMTVESLIKGKKAAATNFWLEGEASVITQRVVVVQVVSSCIVEDVRD